MVIVVKCACGADATSGSSRGECGRCFRRRLGTVRLDKASMDTAELHAYYDKDSVDSQFGADARERMMDATKGLGPGIGKDLNGRPMRRDMDTGQPVPITARELDTVYLAGPERADIV